MNTKQLPLFPLNIVAYPGERVNIHIFEPRYKQLVKECMDEGSTFGIPVYIKNGVSDYGTEMRVISIEKEYAQGEMDIKTEGIQVFRVHEFFTRLQNKLYPGGQVESLENVEDADIVLNQKIREQLGILYEALKITKPLDFVSTFEIAHHIGLNLEQEYALLRQKHESARQQMILEHLERVVPVIIETERLKEKIRLNGHFKNFDPLEF